MEHVKANPVHDVTYITTPDSSCWSTPQLHQHCFIWEWKMNNFVWLNSKTFETKFEYFNVTLQPFEWQLFFHIDYENYYRHPIWHSDVMANFFTMSPSQHQHYYTLANVQKLSSLYIPLIPTLKFLVLLSSVGLHYWTLTWYIFLC